MSRANDTSWLANGCLQTASDALTWGHASGWQDLRFRRGEEGALAEWLGGVGESWETVGESCKNTKHLFLKIDVLGDAATINVVCICMPIVNYSNNLVVC